MFVLCLSLMCLVGFMVGRYIGNKYFVPRIEKYTWQVTGEFTVVNDVENNIFAYIREDPAIPMTIPFASLTDNYTTITLDSPQDGETVSMTRYYIGWKPTSKGFYFSIITKPGISLSETMTHNLKMATDAMSILFVSIIFKLSALLLV